MAPSETVNPPPQAETERAFVMSATSPKSDLRDSDAQQFVNRDHYPRGTFGPQLKKLDAELFPA